MIFNIFTLFPEILEGYMTSSIMAKAVERELIRYQLIDFRSYAVDKHRTCDDAPYGGGAGMVLKPEPLGAALDDYGIPEKGLSDGLPERRRTIFVSPSGNPLTQEKAEELARLNEINIICGRYEGLDQRIVDRYVDEEISVGDYVLSSGEVAALVLIDSIYRLIDGVIRRESWEEDSFQKGILEYPHYTRPEVYKGMGVPDILRSGNHAAIEKWRMKKGLEKTLKVRPDLLEMNRTEEVEKLLNEILQEGK